VLSDISAEALEVAAQNSLVLGADCEVVQSDLFAAFPDRRFDIVTANPPYIPTEAVKALSEEVRREPALALDGGADGLDFYRRIAREIAAHLDPGGAFVTEIGYDQGESVPELFKALGAVKLTKDDGGRDRVVTVIFDKEC
jgi:release factor glutamine methyltransferase